MPLQVSLGLRYFYQEKGENLARLQHLFPQFLIT